MLLENNLRGLQHLGLPVTNLERSQGFYENFGFITTLRTDLQRAEGQIRVAMLEQGGLTIELYELPEGQRHEIAGRAEGHWDHVALDVADIEQAFREITAAGFEVLEKDAPVFLPFWEHGVKFFAIRGPDGEKVEFNQRLSK
jgi:lactoylglutathione lyase